MKNFFTRNRRLIEIILTLLLVVLAAGYYYLVYIPDREAEIIARRFRTLQRTERNMNEKMQGYIQTIKNCVLRGDEDFFQDIVNAYNKEPDKFRIKVLKKETKSKTDFLKLDHDSLMGSLVDSMYDSTNFTSLSSGRKMQVTYKLTKLKKDSTIVSVTVEANINYKEFIAPLLRKHVFDHYLVFNVSDTGRKGTTSTIVYENFASGISFNDVDSLFDAKEKVYSSRIVRIETGGEKYLAFLHPCGYNRKNDRIIAGLLKEKTFHREKQQLPEKMVTTILFIALFTFLLLPVIRLLLMGRKERIRLFDLFACYLSFLLLIPVLILIFFWNRTRFIPDKSCKLSSKQVLANQLSKSLLTDVTSAYKQLRHIDSLHATDTIIKKVNTFNVRYLGHPKGKIPSVHDLLEPANDTNRKLAFAVQRLDAFVSFTKYRNTQFFFWLNSSGRETANWSFNEDPPRGRYNERGYFTRAQNQSNLVFLDDSKSGFAVEPVVSRTDGVFKFIIAQKSFDDSLIVASASRFNSVINPVLPTGYGFSIIDQSGNTVFDCDTTHNLNENLLDEFTNAGPLKSVLNAQVRKEFKTRYEDGEYLVLAQPVPNLSYYIVVAENNSFESALNTQCFSFTIVMLFSYFLFLCIELGIVLSCHTRRTKLFRNMLELSWAYPHESMSGKYLLLALFNTAVLVQLGLFCFIGFSMQRITEYIFLFAIAALLSSIAACMAPATPLTEESKHTALYKSNQLARRSLMILAGAILFTSAFYDDYLLIKLVLFIALAVVLFKVLQKIIPQTKQEHYVDRYRRNFRLMVYSKMLLTSALPVVIFYMCIYNFELRLQGRLRLLDYAKKIEQRSKDNLSISGILNQLKSNNGIKSFYTDSFWIAKVEEVKLPQSNKYLMYSDADKTAIDLLKTSRINYNDISAATNGLEIMKPDESTAYNFNTIFSDTCMLTYNIALPLSNDKITRTVRLSSANFNYWANPCSTQQDYIFLLLLFIALLLCYQLLKYVTGKIFGHAIPGVPLLKTRQEELIKDAAAKYLFVQGIPGMDKNEFIRNCLANNTSCHTTFIDFNNIPPETETAQTQEDAWHAAIAALDDKELNCIVFTHLEYNLHNERANRIKLQLIERFVFDGKKKIIIASAISDTEFIDNIRRSGTSLPAVRADKKTAKDYEEPKEQSKGGEYADRWSKLLGRFSNLYVAAPGEKINDIHESDEAVLITQNLHEQSYRQVWQSLTHEEQLILYDLAADGLVNSNNYLPLFNLMNKGLIVQTDGVLIITTRSFKNFILTVVNGGEMKAIEREVNHGQGWENYKFPVLILIGSLVYFVLSSNPEKFGNVLPLITGIMAGVPTIVKLLSYLKPEQRA